MKVLSLFSGVGGFDMGLENAGMETVFQCEWDKHCRTILDRHWPTVPKWDDVSTLTGEHILAHAPVIDVVAWGSPCQDLSVAGKRAGLEGGRSGLFYEGMRIITELRKASNGKYPRISIWENVYGALNSNKGEDFEAILKEMVEAGSLLCEWRVLDAQYFGVPQRRRRVFVVAVFDSATANRCPDPLLPVSEGLRWHPTTRTTTRQEPSSTASGSIGSGSRMRGFGDYISDDTASAIKARDHKDATDLVIEPFTPSSFAQYEEGVGTLRSNGGDLGGGSETLVVNQDRTYRDVTGALLGRDSFGPNHEGARDGKLVLEPMLIDGRRINDVRVYESPVQTLEARMGTGGNNTPMLAQEPLVFQPGTMIRLNGGVWDGVVPTLRAEAKRGDNEPHITYSIQGGREIEKNQNGLGVAVQGAPAYTIDQTGAQAVAYGITGNAIGRQDHNGPNGPSHTPEDGPMFTLTSTDIHAVAIPIDTRNALRDPNKYDAQNRQGLGIGADGDPMATLTPAHVNGVAAGTATMVVRRLTPLECERLMGWPDDHTRYKADGTEQADTHRYKQCGNGVASPVAEWIGEQLRNL